MRLQEINERMKELRGELTGDNQNIDLGRIESEITALETERNTIEKRAELANRLKIETSDTGKTYAEPKSNVIFRSFGEQLNAIKRSTVTRQIDNRLIEVEKRAAIGANIQSPEAGGFLIQPEFSNELVKNIFATGEILRDCASPININGTSLSWNKLKDENRTDGYRGGGVGVEWTEEAGTLNNVNKKPLFERKTIYVKKLKALFYATEESLDDIGAMESLLNEEFSKEMSYSIENSIIRGSGVGQPLGVMNSGALITVAKETGQSANTILLENLINMRARISAESRNKAKWYMNQEVETQLMYLTLNTSFLGVPVFLPPTGVSGRPYSTLFGIPIVITEQNSGLGSLGDIILADFSKYRLITNGGMQSSQSIHVAFDTDQIAFKLIYRIGGCPTIDTVLTPAYGTTTTSSFVTLAERA